MPSADEAIGALYQQAAQVVGGAAGPASAPHVENAYRTLTTFAHYGDQLSLGLFPLALALLILHENFQAATGDGRLRVAYVLGRAVAIAALIHPWSYGRLCGLITYAAGGHGDWFSSNTLLSSVTRSVDGLMGAWSDYAGDDPGIADSIGALFHILPAIGLWLVLVSCLLLAYVAGALLSLSQAVILSVLLAVGKTCLTVTLVPGVGLGASWARSLAKIAAWSTVGAVITSLMVHAVPDLKDLVRNLAYMSMLRAAGQFVVLAICTFAIPVITERIFSGAAPAGNAALEGLRKGWHGMRAVGGSFAGATRTTMRNTSGDEPGGGGGSHRPHKVAPSRPRQGLAAVGAVALAPLALVAGRIAGPIRPRGVSRFRASAQSRELSATAALSARGASSSTAPASTRAGRAKGAT